jgi:hypothetical protein
MAGGSVRWLDERNPLSYRPIPGLVDCNLDRKSALDLLNRCWNGTPAGSGKFEGGQLNLLWGSGYRQGIAYREGIRRYRILYRLR